MNGQLGSAIRLTSQQNVTDSTIKPVALIPEGNQVNHCLLLLLLLRVTEREREMRVSITAFRHHHSIADGLVVPFLLTLATSVSRESAGHPVHTRLAGSRAVLESVLLTSQAKK